MNVDAFIQHVGHLDERGFISNYPFPVLILGDKKLETSELDSTAQTDCLALQPRTICEDDAADTVKIEERIEFIKKSNRNPFTTVITVGRSRNNDIVINESIISKIHAIFIFDVINNRWQIKDQNSTNGTFIDGGKLDPSRQYDLFDNSQIYFGKEIKASFYTPHGLWAYLQIQQPAKYSKLFKKEKLNLKK